MEFSPEQMAEIQRMINEGMISQTGRSPLRDRQLHDLRLVPTATDPRPLFIPSAELPRDAKPYVYTKFPSIRWHRETGAEVSVKDAKAAAALGPEYVDYPVHLQPLDPMAGMADALAALTDKERDAITANQRDLRMAKLQEQLSQMSESDLETVLASARDRALKAQPEQKKTKSA